MKEYLLPIFAVTLALLSCSFPVLQAEEPAWQTFYSEQRRFSVDLPKKPVITIDPTEMNLKELFPSITKIVVYNFSPTGDENSNRYIMEFAHSDKNMSAKEFYQNCETLLLLLEGDDKKIHYQKRRVQGKKLFFDAAYSKLDLAGQMRIIKYKNAIYLINFSSTTKQGINAKLIEKVLNSFTIN